MKRKRFTEDQICDPGRVEGWRGCAPQKVYPVLIARFRPTMVGCFWPVFFFADHRLRQSILFIKQHSSIQHSGFRML